MRVPADLLNLLRDYHKEMMGETPWLIPMVTDPARHMSSAALCEFVGHVFTVKPCMLRKIYVSHSIKTDSVRTLQKKARFMGHSLERALNSYAVLEDDV